MVLTTLEVIGFIAIRPTHLDRNAFFVQSICHMQQIFRVPQRLEFGEHFCAWEERLVIGTLHSHARFRSTAAFGLPGTPRSAMPFSVRR